jgi:hypothetical protein
MADPSGSNIPAAAGGENGAGAAAQLAAAAAQANVHTTLVLPADFAFDLNDLPDIEEVAEEMELDNISQRAALESPTIGQRPIRPGTRGRRANAGIPMTENMMFTRLGVLRAAPGLEFGTEMPLDNWRPGPHPNGLHPCALANRLPTPEELLQYDGVDTYTEFRKFDNAPPELRDAMRRVIGKLDKLHYITQKVCARIFPTTDKFDQMVKIADGLLSVSGKSSGDSPKPGNVQAYLPSFSGVPKGTTPMQAIRAVHTWVVSVKTSAELQMPTAVEARRVQLATCMFRDDAAQWFVGEKQRAALVNSPINTFSRLQTAMLDHFVEGKVHDLVGIDFTSKHLKDFDTYTAYVDWLLQTIDLLHSSAPPNGAWPDHVLVFHVCNQLIGTEYHENVHELNGERCASMQELMERLKARHAVLSGRGRQWKRAVQEASQLRGEKAALEAQRQVLAKDAKAQGITVGSRPNKGKSRGGGAQVAEVTCRHCGKYGHYANQCPERAGERENGAEPGGGRDNNGGGRGNGGGRANGGFNGGGRGGWKGRGHAGWKRVRND